MKIRATLAQKEKGRRLDQDWVHVTPNQDFNGVEGDLEGVDSDFGAFLLRGVDCRHQRWAVFHAGRGVLLRGPRHDRRGRRWGGAFDRARRNERGREHSLGCLPL